MPSEDTWGRTSSCMYCSRKGEALRLSTGMLKKPWISFWWRSMVIRWVRPALNVVRVTTAAAVVNLNLSCSLKAVRMLRANKTPCKQTLVFLLTYQLYTSWRRWAWRRWSPSSSSYTACCRGSRGGHLWCFWHRMFCTRTPWSASPLWWCSHLWQREGAERSNTKTERGERQSERDVLGEKRRWDVNAACCSSFLLGHCLDDKDIFASHRLLDLYPRFYGNKQDVRREEAGMQAHQTQTPLCVCYLLITKPPWPVSLTRGLSVPFVPGHVKICYPRGCIFARCFVLLATRWDKPQHEETAGRNNE